MNGANEVAVAQFLRGEIGFNDISRRVEQALSRVAVKYQPSLADILEADRLGREAAG
jgi:1-deoxy-D-xylulose-5-phosphate reductoisomerase